MKARSLVFAGMALLFLPALAQADSIDFETLADGTTTPTSLDSAATEYTSFGVAFAGGGTAGQPVFRNYNTLSSGIATRPTGNDWFIITLSKTGGGSDFDLHIIFSTPVLGASGDVVFNPGTSVTATAYDASDNWLAAVTIPSGASTWIGGSFSFSPSLAIARIHLLPGSSAASVGLDNLGIGSPIPEPSTLALVGAVIGVLAWRRLRKRQAA